MSSPMLKSSPMPKGGKRDGAGRPTQYGEQTRSVTFASPVSLYRAVVKYADENNLSNSQALVALLRKALNL